MGNNSVDFTLAFRYLKFILPGENQKKWVNLFKNKKDKNLINFANEFRERIKYENNDLTEIKEILNKNNPIIIPRNHNIQTIIDKALLGEFEYFHKFNEIIKSPYCSSLEDNLFSKPAHPEQEIKETFCGT